jgi:hypothetical protein
MLTVTGYAWSQKNEKDTIVTTVSAQKASLNFRADILPDYIQLQWNKGPDDFTGYFELYRSDDGVAYNIVKQFQPESPGNTADYFNYRDEDPLRGKNYYRLIGYNRFTQEKRSVDLIADYKNLPRKIQPTIVAKGKELNVVNYDGEELHLFVYTSGGTPLFQKVVTSGVVNLSTNNLSSGIYVYQLLDRKKMVVSSGKFALL